ASKCDSRLRSSRLIVPIFSGLVGLAPCLHAAGRRDHSANHSNILGMLNQKLLHVMVSVDLGTTPVQFQSLVHLVLKRISLDDLLLRSLSAEHYFLLNLDVLRTLFLLCLRDQSVKIDARLCPRGRLALGEQ